MKKETTSISQYTNIRKEDGLTGDYPSRRAIDDYGFTISWSDDDDGYYEEYIQWAKEHGADTRTESIVTSANNPDALNKRYDILSHLIDVSLGEEEPDPKIAATIPGHVYDAFTDIAAENPESVKNILYISTLDTIPYFKIQEEFSDLRFKFTVAAATEEHARSCNRLIQAKAPGLESKLVWNSFWEKEPADLVIVNFPAQYCSEDELRDFVGVIKDTGAKRVVFHDLFMNKSESGTSYWQIQPCNGGIIPLRMLAVGELEKAMAKAGFDGMTHTMAEMSFYIDPRNGIKNQHPETESFTFTRNLAPS